MSSGQITLLAIAAVVVFWMVGAYNRLVALRTAIGQAWAPLEAQLQQRRAALTPAVPVLREALQEDPHAAEALLGALAQVQAAADAVRVRPVSVELPAALLTAEQALAAALARVFALIEYHPELRDGDGEVTQARQALLALEPQLAFARQLFNLAVDQYNEAVRQFPTNVLAAVYGFRTAGHV